jgi:hypothetical protein
MQNAKEESANSIKIMQEHNWVVDFLKHKLQILKTRLRISNILSNCNNKKLRVKLMDLL